MNYIIIGIIGTIGLIIIGFYNAIIRKKNEIDNAFGSIDVMLKKRYDLLPNLVEVTMQYMNHEKGLFTEITQLRTQINSNISSDEKLEKYNSLQRHTDKLMLNVENYPDLKASQNFLNLQASWNSSEEQISASRRYFNSSVTIYNNSIQIFPANLIAGYFGFKSKNVFEINENERENINARDLFASK